jgi:hypothetical protein
VLRGIIAAMLPFDAAGFPPITLDGSTMDVGDACAAGDRVGTAHQRRQKKWCGLQNGAPADLRQGRDDTCVSLRMPGVCHWLALFHRTTVHGESRIARYSQSRCLRLVIVPDLLRRDSDAVDHDHGALSGAADRRGTGAL